MRSRGQALVELAVCMPVALLLGLGAAGVVEVADAASGLRAATDAAVASAVRQPSAPAAIAAAEARFNVVLAAYPIRKGVLTLTAPSLARGASVTAMATGDVDLGWEALSFLPTSIHLTATASMRIEPWRTHR